MVWIFSFPGWNSERWNSGFFTVWQECTGLRIFKIGLFLILLSSRSQEASIALGCKLNSLNSVLDFCYQVAECGERVIWTGAGVQSFLENSLKPFQKNKIEFLIRFWGFGDSSMGKVLAGQAHEDLSFLIPSIYITSWGWQYASVILY